MSAPRAACRTWCRSCSTAHTLRHLLDAGALPARKATDYAVQVANGLAAAHDRGIVHRDLKPENVFVTRDGRVKILDFGLAKLVASSSGTSQATALQTDPGTVLGTAGYMAPEQLRGEDVDARSDIFSLRRDALRDARRRGVRSVAAPPWRR